MKILICIFLLSLFPLFTVPQTTTLDSSVISDMKRDITDNVKEIDSNSLQIKVMKKQIEYIDSLYEDSTNR